MHGSQRTTFSRQMHSIKRRQKPVQTVVVSNGPVSVPQGISVDSRIDIGDWSLAQDADGALIIHNVMTGNRIIIARP